MERLTENKVETQKVYLVDIVCATHGTIASAISQSDVENQATAHRDNKQCFANLDVNIRTDKPMVSPVAY